MEYPDLKIIVIYFIVKLSINTYEVMLQAIFLHNASCV